MLGTSNRPRYGIRPDRVPESRREAVAPQGSTRRSLFPQHDVTSAGPRGGTITNFYGAPRRDSTVTESRTGPWQPGETLDLPVHTSAQPRQTLSRAFNDFVDDDDDDLAANQHRQLPTREHALRHEEQPLLWSDVKALISAEFARFHESLEQINDRICDVEDTIVNLEKKVTDIESEGQSSSSGSASATPSGGTQKRKRRSPLSLQVWCLVLLSLNTLYRCLCPYSLNHRAKSEQFTSPLMKMTSFVL